MKLILSSKIPVMEYEKKSERFRSLKFVLEPLEQAIFFPHKKVANTYFFCQKVDLCFVNRDGTILSLYSNVRSEKLIFCFKAYGLYYLPLGTSTQLQVGKKIPVK